MHPFEVQLRFVSKLPNQAPYQLGHTRKFYLIMVKLDSITERINFQEGKVEAFWRILRYARFMMLVCFSIRTSLKGELLTIGNLVEFVFPYYTQCFLKMQRVAHQNFGLENKVT